jgi:hypothetical protein
MTIGLGLDHQWIKPFGPLLAQLFFDADLVDDCAVHRNLLSRKTSGTASRALHLCIPFHLSKMTHNRSLQKEGDQP